MPVESPSTSGNRKVVSIGSVLQALPDKPVATSRARQWSGVTVDVHEPVKDYALHTPAHDHHLISYCLSGSARLIQRRDGVTHDHVFSPGMLLLMPAGYESAWDGNAPHCARLRIPTSLVTAAADQIGSRSVSQTEIRNVFETSDAFIERVAQTLVAELNRPEHPAQALIADTMSCALAAHLLRSYNAFQAPDVQKLPPLGNSELARIEKYIADHLDHPIGLADLASLVNISRFHFARVFKRSTGTTPIKYVESCRIRRAQDLIAETDLPLAQIALMAGFSDQSHFTRRFHNHVGVTPAVYARERGRRRSARRFD
ncbi:helix-turn-helix domain-containing protein [Azospirillum endophyticum]